MNVISQLWAILGPRQRRRVLGAQVLALLMAFSTVTGIASIAPFFAVLGQPRMIDRNPGLHWLYVHGGFADARSFTVGLGLAFIALVLLANLINAWGSVAMNRLALRIGAELQIGLFEEYLARPYIFHTATDGTTLCNNIIYETARVANGILQNVLALLSNVVIAACIILSALLVKPAFTLLLFAALGGGYLAIYLCLRPRLLRLGQAQSQAWLRRAKIVTETFGAIREVLLNRRPYSCSGRFAEASREIAAANTRIHLVGQLPKHVMECVAVAALVAAALLPGSGSELGSWLGQLTFIGFAAYRLLPILQQIFTAAVRIRADRPALAILAAELGRVQPALPAAEPSSATSASIWSTRPREEIRLNGVVFRYPASRSAALECVDMRIPARMTVGLVGSNGSGKTTLMDLLAGLLVPAAGEVRIDGVALDDSNRAHWQRQIAYVPQNGFLLDASVMENIAFGTSHDIDRERVIQAARLAQLEGFIASLPHGYDHLVGERGIRLSGGQRQRIGIARALYKRAEVLLLDEAVSALDGSTETELTAALESLRGRCTIVLVAHRPSMVRWCDLIFQLENGRITTSGTYEQLSGSSEPFRRTIGA